MAQLYTLPLADQVPTNPGNSMVSDAVARLVDQKLMEYELAEQERMVGQDAAARALQRRH